VRCSITILWRSKGQILANIAAGLDAALARRRDAGARASTTPHQYVVRARLRLSAQRLADAPGKIVDIALDCGFEDVSNFNRAFRAEFGESPRAYRARLTG
jgi:AraC-like DNA-binding protein